jgi:hypothetical protein
MALLSLVVSTPGNAQPGVGKNYVLPNEFELFENPADSSYLTYEIDGRFYPIGWSSNGKFAYIKVSDASLCECYGVEIVVYDVALNQAKCTWSYAQEEDSLHLNNVADIWKHFYSPICKSLDSFHIVQYDKLKPVEKDPFFDKDYYLPLTWGLSQERGLSFRLNNKACNITLTDYIAKVDSSLSTTDEYVKNYTFHLEKDSQIVNRIIHVAAADRDVGLLDIGLLHAFTDPTRNWGVFVYGKHYIGWEGPPTRNDFEVEGFAP